MDGGAHTGIGAAAANIGHGCIDVFVGGPGFLFQQRNGCQHLTALAVTALGYLVVYPSFLDSMKFAFGGQALDADHLLSCSRRYGVRARADRFAVEENGTSTAKGNAATVFRAFDIEFIAQCPQQWHFGFDIELVGLSVDVEFHDVIFRFKLSNNGAALARKLLRHSKLRA